MVADALHHCRGTGIPHAEALPGHAVYESLAAGGSVQGHIADDDVLGCLEAAAPGRIYNQLAAGKALAEIVVALSRQLQRQPPGDERTEGLAARTSAQHPVEIFLQIISQDSGNLASQNGAQRPIGVRHVYLQASSLSGLDVFLQLF